MLQQINYPFPVDAFSLIHGGEKLNRCSIVRYNGQTYQIDRANGFVLTLQQGSNFIGVDLRNRSIVVYVVSLAVWVEQQPLI